MPIKYNQNHDEEQAHNSAELRAIQETPRCGVGDENWPRTKKRTTPKPPARVKPKRVPDFRRREDNERYEWKPTGENEWTLYNRKTHRTIVEKATPGYAGFRMEPLPRVADLDT